MHISQSFNKSLSRDLVSPHFVRNMVQKIDIDNSKQRLRYANHLIQNEKKKRHTERTQTITQKSELLKRLTGNQLGAPLLRKLFCAY